MQGRCEFRPKEKHSPSSSQDDDAAMEVAVPTLKMAEADLCGESCLVEPERAENTSGRRHERRAAQPP